MTAISLQKKTCAGLQRVPIYYYLLLLVTGIFFFAEINNTLHVKAGENALGSAISSYVKIGLEGFFFLSFFFHGVMLKKDMKILGVSLFLLGTSYAGNYWLVANNVDISVGVWAERMAEQGTYASNTAFFYANQCVFFFLCFCFYRRGFSVISKENENVIFKLYEAIVCFYGITAVLGFLSGAEILRTYPYSDRWGYNGLLPYTNASSGFWLVALFYGLIIHREKKKKGLMVLSVVAMLLAGAKSLWLLALCVIVAYFWKFYSRKFFLWVGIASVAVCAAAVMFLPVLRNHIDIIDNILLAIQYKDDILQVLTSNRLNMDGDTGRIMSAFAIMESLSLFNYLLGGLGGLVVTEMAFIDIPFAFGILGTVIFVGIYLKIFRYIHYDYRRYFAFFYFGTAFLIGWLFNTPSLAPYLTLFIMKAHSIESKASGDTGHETNETRCLCL